MDMRTKIAKAMLEDLRTSLNHDEPYIESDPVALKSVVIDGHISLLSLADAVLSTLAEPDEGMMQAGSTKHWGTDQGDCAGSSEEDEMVNCGQIWQAMIAAARLPGGE